MKKDDVVLFEILATKLVNNLTEAKRDDKGKFVYVYNPIITKAKTKDGWDDYNCSQKRNQRPEELKSQIKMIRKVLMDISEDL